MNLRTVLYALLALALATGCNLFKKAPPPEPVQADAAPAVEEVPAIPEPDGGLAEPTEGGESTAAADAILEQMKAAGLQADPFKKVGGKYGAKNCLQGVIDSIPTMMCEYTDPDAAKAGKDKAEDFAKGEITGVVDRNGRTVMALKANKELDKTGEKVNRIITQFNKAK